MLSFFNIVLQPIHSILVLQNQFLWRVRCSLYTVSHMGLQGVTRKYCLQFLRIYGLKTNKHFPTAFFGRIRNQQEIYRHINSFSKCIKLYFIGIFLILKKASKMKKLLNIFFVLPWWFFSLSLLENKQRIMCQP